MSDATPAPGGGVSLALAGGLAAALVEMAAAFALRRDPDHPRAQEIAGRARAARARALGLAEQERSAFEPVLAALRTPPSPARERELAAALSAAADSPLAIAELAAELAEGAAELAATGNPNLEGDATAGALLAEAAAQGAARLVALNLAAAAGDPRVARAAALAQRARAARRRALRESGAS